jgi:putative membrane protein
MTAFRPGFMDDPKTAEPTPGPMPIVTIERQVNPGFVDTTSLPPEPRPVAISAQPRSPGLGALGWIGAGLGILVVGGSLLSLTGFVVDQMARSQLLGWASLTTVSAGVFAVLWGVAREIRSYRRLTRVDALRGRLRPPAVPVEVARAECTAWLATVAHRLADPDQVRLAMNGCTTTDEVRAMLAHRAIEPLREQATAIGARAASQGAAMVAIIPSPALEGLAAGLRSLKLIRDIAALYGLRPGMSVTLGLMRRAAVTAASVYGVNEIAAAAAAHFLADAPVLRSIASAAPGAGITARRIYLLAQTVAEACSPL